MPDISNLIETASLAKIREQQFVDDVETAEIRENRDLMRRLKKGSSDGEGYYNPVNGQR